MKKPLLLLLCLIVMIVAIVGIDVLFLSHQFWERLVVNVAIFLVFITVYLKFLRLD